MPKQTLSRSVPRRRWFRIAVIAAVLSVVVLLAADRVLAAVAAGRIADRLQCAAGMARRPDVAIHGGPFLPQALSGRYRSIDVTARDLHRGELRLASVRASLRNTAMSDGTVSIGDASVEAVVPFDALPARLGEREVAYSESDGLLAIATTAAVAGRQLPVTLLGRPAISDGTLRIDPQEVEVLGVRRPAKHLLDRLGTRDGVSRKLPDLPPGLQYAAVGVRPDGLTITLTGSNLSIHTGAQARAAAAASPGSPSVPSSKHCGAQR